MTLEQFIYMGGYGNYVWGSYAIAFIILAVNIAVAVGNKRHTIKMIKMKLEFDNNDT